MCGIAGFISRQSPPDSSLILRRMTDAIAHRGPDDSGFYTDGRAALGHRRLSIVDLLAGHQPMANESGSLQIVYNGEIFNHAQLRPMLERSGHTYRTHCDTETIVHAYEQFGPECLSSFRGMFAFAIWDAQNERLFCARDRLGKKPFYYFWNGGVFAFASEIKALLVHPAISAEFESQSLPEYLAFGYLSGENTLFRGIKKLQPGHYLALDFARDIPRFEVTEYWDIPSAKPARASETDLIRETRRRLEETVQLRLMSDVPLGMFLSGGVDSSAIAAIASRLTGAPIQTFSVGYDDERFSELGCATQVARAIGASHHEVRIGMDQFFDALPRLIWHEDEPIAWPSSVPLYFVSKLAAGRVKVVLTGEGSDELFGGYERYRWNLLNVRAASAYKHLPQSLRKSLRRFIQRSSLIRADLRRKLSHTFLLRESSVESLYLDNFYSAFPGTGTGYANYLGHFQKHATESLLARMLYADQKTYLVELLMKQDQMSMAASIESRVPLLDHELVEFASSIPDSLKIHGGVQKYIFKKAIEDLLPREIVFRKKMGFPTPLRAWLLDRKARPFYDALLNRSGFVASVLDMEPLEQLIQRHLQGQEDATDRIWRLLTLELWAGLFITGAAGGWQALPCGRGSEMSLFR
ncbi:MAG: asparagine synthase (glutamine-hydrolyzing) [Bryobacteraceae bacterium]